MNTIIKYLTIIIISLTLFTSCDLNGKNTITVRITGTQNIVGAEYQVGAFSYDRLDEGVLGAYIGKMDGSVTEDVLKEINESFDYDPNAANKEFLFGEEVYIGARVIHNEVVYETEFLELITVENENIIYISFNDMIEKDSHDLQ